MPRSEHAVGDEDVARGGNGNPSGGDGDVVVADADMTVGDRDVFARFGVDAVGVRRIGRSGDRQPCDRDVVGCLDEEVKLGGVL